MSSDLLLQRASALLVVLVAVLAVGSTPARSAAVASKTRTCNAGALYATTGVGRIVTRNLSCRKARAEMRNWVRTGHRHAGPPGWACRIDTSGENQPGPVTGYRCRRSSSVMRFLVGG